MATARRFVQNAAMTAIAIGFKNPDVAYVADLVMPRVPVPTETFKWLRYVDAEAFTLPATKVGRKGKVNEVEFSAAEESGSVETYGLQSVIPKSDIDAAAAQRKAGLSTYDPRNFTTAMLTNLMLLDREIRVAAAVQAAGNYDAGNVVNLVTAGDRFDAATGDPEAVIDQALNGTFIVRPNTAVFPRAGLAKDAEEPEPREGGEGHEPGGRQDHSGRVQGVFRAAEPLYRRRLREFGKAWSGRGNGARLGQDGLLPLP